MPRKYLRRYLPPPAELEKHWLLRRLGTRLHHPRLWHLNRRSVSGAAGVGLFIAFIPVPFQMFISAFVALWLRVNLPLSVALIFITNPLTIAPAFYGCYRLGALLLGEPAPVTGKGFEPTIGWLLDQLGAIWQPLLVGSLAISTVSGLLGYGLVQAAWRLYVVRKRGALLRALGHR